MKKVLIIALMATTGSLYSQNALHFDGSNDYVQTTFPGVFGNSDRTFEAWIRVSVGAPSSNLCILDYGTNVAGSRNTFNVSGSRTLSYIAGGTNTNISSGGSVITDGVWTHVAIVMNSGTGYLYVNGVQVGIGSLSGVNTPSTGTDLRIGQRVAGGSIPFEGEIDEVRIWDHARTGTQIANSFNSELCSAPTGLVAYYQFNQGSAGSNNSGLTTLKEAIDGNDGALTNLALSGATSNWVSGATITPGLTFSSSTETECDSLLSPSGLYYWTNSGIKRDTIPNSNACDSIIRIDLTINKSQFIHIEDTVCEEYLSPSGNYTYTTSGTYYDTTTTAQGCANYHTLDLQINIIDSTVSVLGHQLASNEMAAGHYIWLDCANDFSTISGSSNRIFNPTKDGEYAVRVTKGTCIDTSECITVTGVGVNGLNNIQKTDIYPNPAKDKLTVRFSESITNGSLKVLNTSGQELIFLNFTNQKELILNMNTIPVGLYLLQVEGDGQAMQQRIIKK